MKETDRLVRITLLREKIKYMRRHNESNALTDALELMVDLLEARFALEARSR